MLGLAVVLLVLGDACVSYPCTQEELQALGDRFFAECGGDSEAGRCDVELDAQRRDMMPDDASARFAAANAALEGVCSMSNPNVTLCGTIDSLGAPRWMRFDTAVNVAARVVASQQQLAVDAQALATEYSDVCKSNCSVLLDALFNARSTVMTLRPFYAELAFAKHLEFLGTLCVSDTCKDAIVRASSASAEQRVALSPKVGFSLIPDLEARVTSPLDTRPCRGSNETAHMCRAELVARFVADDSDAEVEIQMAASIAGGNRSNAMRQLQAFWQVSQASCGWNYKCQIGMRFLGSAGTAKVSLRCVDVGSRLRIVARFKAQYLHSTLLRELCTSDDCVRRLDVQRQTAFDSTIAAWQRLVFNPQASPGGHESWALWIGVGVALWSGLTIGFWVVSGQPTGFLYDDEVRSVVGDVLQQTLTGLSELLAAITVAAVLAVLFRNYLVALISLKRDISTRLERSITVGIAVVCVSIFVYCVVGWIVLYPAATSDNQVIRWTDQALPSPRVELRIYPVIISLCLLFGTGNVVCGVITTTQLHGRGVLRRDVVGSLFLTLASVAILAGLILRSVVAYTAYSNSSVTGILPPESFIYGVNHLAGEALICGGMLFIALFSLYALRRRRIASMTEASVDNYVPLQESVPHAYSNY